jgi:hypothetical protein
MSEQKQSGSGPVPQSEIHEDSITNFSQKTGDSSRSILIVILVLAALMLAGIFFLSQPKTADEVEATQPVHK